MSYVTAKLLVSGQELSQAKFHSLDYTCLFCVVFYSDFAFLLFIVLKQRSIIRNVISMGELFVSIVYACIRSIYFICRS